MVRSACPDRLARNDVRNADPEAGLACVNFLLGILSVLLPLTFDFVNCLLEHFLQFSLAGQLFVVLDAASLQRFSFVVKRHFKLLHESLVPFDFFFLGLDLLHGVVVERAALHAGRALAEAAIAGLLVGVGGTWELRGGLGLREGGEVAVDDGFSLLVGFVSKVRHLIKV